MGTKPTLNGWYNFDKGLCLSWKLGVSLCSVLSTVGEKEKYALEWNQEKCVEVQLLALQPKTWYILPRMIGVLGKQPRFIYIHKIVGFLVFAEVYRVGLKNFMFDPVYIESSLEIFPNISTGFKSLKVNGKSKGKKDYNQYSVFFKAKRVAIGEVASRVSPISKVTGHCLKKYESHTSTIEITVPKPMLWMKPDNTACEVFNVAETEVEHNMGYHTLLEILEYFSSFVNAVQDCKMPNISTSSNTFSLLVCLKKVGYSCHVVWVGNLKHPIIDPNTLHTMLKNEYALKDPSTKDPSTDQPFKPLNYYPPQSSYVNIKEPLITPKNPSDSQSNPDQLDLKSEFEKADRTACLGINPSNNASNLITPFGYDNGKSIEFVIQTGTSEESKYALCAMLPNQAWVGVRFFPESSARVRAQLPPYFAQQKFHEERLILHNLATKWGLSHDNTGLYWSTGSNWDQVNWTVGLMVGFLLTVFPFGRAKEYWGKNQSLNGAEKRWLESAVHKNVDKGTIYSQCSKCGADTNCHFCEDSDCPYKNTCESKEDGLMCAICEKYPVSGGYCGCEGCPQKAKV